MTGQAVVDRLRSLIHDEHLEYRYSDTVLLPVLNDAVRELASARPDLLLDADGVATDVLDLTALSETVPFDERYRLALAHNMAALLYEADGTDETNQKLAQLHRQNVLRLT
jgi:hypothetical protein